jgi:hypothetical protein
MARDKLTQGMTSTGHIILGNHEVIRTNGSAPITSFYPTQANRVGSLGPVVEPHSEQCLRK